MRFNVTRERDGATEYLTESLQWTTEPEQALWFEFGSAVTARARMRIRSLRHEMAGGLAAFADREQALFRSRQRLQEEIEAQLWPDGRPEITGTSPEDNQARAIQNEAFNQAWGKSESVEMVGFSELAALDRAEQFCAAWTVTFVKATIGAREIDGWADISVVDFPNPIVFEMLMARFGQEAAAGGKAPSSSEQS